jgi:hypothetical protein
MKAPERVRTVLLRIGIVLGEEGGSLAEMVRPFRFGLLAHRLMPLPARLGAPRRPARTGARARSEGSELLRTHFDAPGFDINAHQGRTK